VRYWLTERLVVAMTAPVEFVERSADVTPVIPKFVVVAPVARREVAKKLVEVAEVSSVLALRVVDESVALVPNTSAPLPVSSVTKVDNSEDVSIDVDPSLALNWIQSAEAK